jgi:hypothetical protein
MRCAWSLASSRRQDGTDGKPQSSEPWSAVRRSPRGQPAPTRGPPTRCRRLPTIFPTQSVALNPCHPERSPIHSQANGSTESKDPCDLKCTRERGVFHWRQKTARSYAYDLAIGVLRLRDCFAKRSSHSAQDDSFSARDDTPDLIEGSRCSGSLPAGVAVGAAAIPCVIFVDVVRSPLIKWFRQAASRLQHEAIARNPRQDRRVGHLVPVAETQSRDGRVAQLAEHSTLNRQVEGSIPSAPTIFRQY